MRSHGAVVPLLAGALAIVACGTRRSSGDPDGDPVREEVRTIANVLADYGVVEGRGVSIGGWSYIFTIYERLAFLATRGELVALLRHPSPVTRAYAASAIVATQPVIAPQGAWVRHWVEVVAGTFDVHAWLEGPDGGPLEAEVTVVVRNPARDAVIQACRACDGQWIRGLGDQRCSCRTADAGQPCTSRDQCQGPCMFQRWVPAEGGSPRAEDAPPCEDREILYVGQGTCGERTMITGCVEVLDEMPAPGHPDHRFRSIPITSATRKTATPK